LERPGTSICNQKAPRLGVVDSLADVSMLGIQ
jgi:hypothetical protein